MAGRTWFSRRVIKQKSAGVIIMSFITTCAILNVYFISSAVYSSISLTNDEDRNIAFHDNALIKGNQFKGIHDGKQTNVGPHSGVLKRHLLDAVVNSLTVPAKSANKTDGVDINEQLNMNKVLNYTFKFTSKENHLKERKTDFIGCKEISELRQRTIIGSGYTKVVESAWLSDSSGRRVALKHPFRNGKDVKACISRGSTEDECVKVASYKVMKEMALLQQLMHPNIVKLFGYCIESPELPRRADAKTVLTVVVEYGEPLSFLKLIQQPWEERLRMAYGVTGLLVYFTSSPLGSLVIHDFKSTQFVTVQGEIKLTDLDDIDSNIPECTSRNTCALQLGNTTKELPCNANNQCSTYAETHNMFYAWRRFYSLLEHGGPKKLQPSVDKFLKETGLLSLSPIDALGSLLQIIKSYREGLYIQPFNQQNDSFTVIENVDIPARHDYWCEQSRNLEFNSCVISVFNENEAKQLCQKDKYCQAFVFTSQRTWTGRYVVYFKDGLSSLVKSEGNILYIRNS